MSEVKYEFHHFESVESTNSTAKELTSRLQTNIVVTAEYQSKGRGRNNKQWVGESGQNLYLSIGLYKQDWTEYIQDFQIVGCLSVQRTLEQLIPNVNIKIKYPNDVYCVEGEEYKKICGVLVENEFRGSELLQTVIGIGLNVNQLDFGDSLNNASTSLRRICSIMLDTHRIATDVSKNFFEILQQSSDDVFLQWREYVNILDRKIHIDNGENEYIVKRVQRDGRIECEELSTQIVHVINSTSSIRYQL